MKNIENKKDLSYTVQSKENKSNTKPNENLAQLNYAIAYEDYQLIKQIYKY